MKTKLQAMLARLEARISEIDKSIEGASDVKVLKELQVERNKVSGEVAEVRGMLEALDANPAPATPPAAEPQQRSAGPIGQTQILGTFGVGHAQPPAGEQRIADPYGTMEYRMAFMEFAKTGRVAPELRIDAMTATTDVSALIPSTILNEVIKKLNIYGQVFTRVRKMSVAGGVTVPILTLNPTASWITQAAPSDKLKITVNTSVTFSYYGLECKVATSLLASTVTLTGFENTIIDLIGEAMVKALDAAIVSGVGTTQPLGITQDARVPVAQVVTLGSADIDTWDGWKKNVFAKMPLAYKGGAIFLMASGTFESYIDGMVDANGQPVGRINYGIADGAQERFGGKEVVLVEDDIIEPYDDADVGDVIAIYCNLRNYAVNSNMQMTMFRYLDHDTNEWIDKAILIADGKLTDPNGVVVVKKGA